MDVNVEKLLSELSLIAEDALERKDLIFHQELTIIVKALEEIMTKDLFIFVGPFEKFGLDHAVGFFVGIAQAATMERMGIPFKLGDVATTH